MINIKHTLFIVLGLLIVTVVFIALKLNTATAAKTSTKKDGKKFNDWVVQCAPKDEKKKTSEYCLLTQQVNITQENEQKPLALFQLGYFGPEKELKMVQTLPLGVRLGTGTAIISSKKLIAPGAYTVCTQTGCQAIAPISDTDLKTLISTKEAAIAFMNSEGQQLTLPVSVTGMEKGLQYIK